MSLNIKTKEPFLIIKTLTIRYTFRYIRMFHLKNYIWIEAQKKLISLNIETKSMFLVIKILTTQHMFRPIWTRHYKRKKLHLKWRREEISVVKYRNESTVSHDLKIDNSIRFRRVFHAGDDSQRAKPDGHIVSARVLYNNMYKPIKYRSSPRRWKKTRVGWNIWLECYRPPNWRLLYNYCSILDHTNLSVSVWRAVPVDLNEDEMM